MISLREIVRYEAGLSADASKHPGANLLAVMKGKDDIRPIGTLQNAMRAGGTLDPPADA
jgi:hypothetical protein